MSAAPPRWAERLLQHVLRPSDFESVSGDLLEQYRDKIRPERGRRAADAWYLSEVLGFVWRGSAVWAALFAASDLVRAGLDWRQPPQDFHLRSLISTAIGVGLVLAAGAWSARRSGSVFAGTIAGLATIATAACLDIAGAGVLLAMWHDPQTMAAVDASGGLGEAFSLPFLLIVPGGLIGTVGGLAGAALSRFRHASG